MKLGKQNDDLKQNMFEFDKRYKLERQIDRKAVKIIFSVYTSNNLVLRSLH